MNKEEMSRYVRVRDDDDDQIDESECDYLIEQKLVEQVEPDYLQDPRFKVVVMKHFVDATRTPFPYRSFYVPLKEVEEKIQYNPYYLVRRVSMKEEAPVEVCIGEDQCVLESSDEYLEKDDELCCVCDKHDL